MPRKRNRKTGPRNRARRNQYASIVTGLLSPFAREQDVCSPLFTPLPNRGNRVSFTYKKLYPITTNASGYAAFGFRPSPSGMNCVTHNPTEVTPGFGDFVMDYKQDILDTTSTDHLESLSTINGAIHYIPVAPDNVSGTLITINERDIHKYAGAHDAATYVAGDLNRGSTQEVISNMEFSALCRPTAREIQWTQNDSNLSDVHEYGSGFLHGEIVLQFQGPASTTVGYVTVACRVDGYYRITDGPLTATALHYNSGNASDAPHRAVKALFKHSLERHPIAYTGSVSEAVAKLTNVVSKHSDELLHSLMKQGGAALAGVVTGYFTEDPRLASAAYSSTLAIENVIDVD